jgi:hypothetical protein
LRVALLLIAALLFSSHDAQAQVWRPERKRPTKQQEAPAKPKPKPKRKKPKPKAKPAPKPAEPEPEAEPETEPETEPEAEPDEETVDEDEENVEEETVDEPGDGTIRITDEDEPGAKVKFSDEDLATETASEPGKSVTRLETLAMAYFRMGVDTVHDNVPVAPTGVKAVGEDTLAFRAHARAEGIGRFSPRIKVKAAGRFNADLSLDNDTKIGVERYEAEVWDTYVDLYAPHLDTRIGRQIIAWGVNDLLSPNDVVNPRDLRRGFLEQPDELRLPVLAVSATAYDGPFYAQGIWLPVAPANRFELLEGDYALLGPNAATPAERRVGAILSTLADDPMTALQIRPLLDIGARPDNGIDTGELGASLGLRFRKLDLAGYFLWGHERNPRFRLHPDLTQLLVDTPPDEITPELIAGAIANLAMMGQAAVDVDYPRRIHAGAALATRVEPFGFKLEAAYTFEGTTLLVPPGAGPLLSQPTQLPQVAAAASMDYDRGSDLTIILEAAHYQVLDVPGGLDVYQFDHDKLDLIATRFEYTPFKGPVSFRLLAFLEVGAPSYAVAPAVRVSGHDNLSLELSAALFGGPATSFGGVATDNDEVLFTLQYGL